MALLVVCPTCRKQMNVPDVLHGKRVRCPQCDSMVLAAMYPGAAPKQPPAPAASKVVRPPPVPAPAAAVAVAAPVALAEPAIPDAPLPAPLKFMPFSLRLQVLHDPRRQLRGSMTGWVSSVGLRLRSAKFEWHIPLGTTVRYAGLHHITVLLEDREVKLSLIDRGLDNRRLARDLVAFLLGQRPALSRADYRAPYWPILAAPLPLAVPLVVAVLFLVKLVGVVTLATAAVLGLVLAFFALVAVWFDRRLLVRRLIWPVLLFFVGAAAMPLLYVAGIGLGSVFDGKPSWSKYTSPDGRWTISMPGSVTVGTQTMKAPNGSFVCEKHESQLMWSQSEFIVLVADLTQPGAVNMTPEQRFRSARDNTLASDKDLTLVKEFDVTLQGRYPGREMHFSHPRAGKVRFRVYVAGNTLYVIGASASRLDDKEFDTFFDSFQVLQAR